ncbi:hypothetical protein [Kibdelosporangium philippinense]|uniref:hypothetical protein n=1 Tax=Kibdelosporangium philippinense TaxID=211113 RepID=UPI0036159DD6
MQADVDQDGRTLTAPIIRTTKRRFLVAAAAGAVLAAILMDYEVPGIPLPEPSTVEAPRRKPPPATRSSNRCPNGSASHSW